MIKINDSANLCETCDLFPSKNLSTILYENNTTWIAQIKEGYIKENEQNIFHQRFSTTNLLKG